MTQIAEYLKAYAEDENERRKNFREDLLAVFGRR
jgi:hypothetical protein